MKRLLKYLSDYKKECVIAPLFKLLEALFDLIVPMVTAAMIDHGIGSRDEGLILRYGGILLLLAMVGLTCSIIAQYFAAKAAVGFAAKLRHALFAHVETFSFTEIDEIGTSTLITRLTSDVNQLQSGVNMALRLFLRSPFIVFGAMILSFTYDVKIALLFVGAIILLSAVVFGIMAISTPLYKKVQGYLDRVLGAVKENLTGVRVIRAFHREKEEEKEYREWNGTLSKEQLFVGRIAALTNPVTYVIVNLTLVLLLWSSGLRIDAGGLQQGQVVALIGYLSQILVELIKLANTIVLTNKSLASANRIADVLDKKSILTDRKLSGEVSLYDENVSKANPFSGKAGGQVVFKNAALCYKGSRENSVEGVEFTAEPGEVIGIIGGTGSGKTSLISLIPRFYDVTQGAVYLDGKDVRTQEIEALRKKIGIVMQKAVLFKGTIRENLLWGNEKADDAELEEALKLSQAWEFVEKKEKGMDTMIAQGGRNLSGGQRQRLSIARALVRKPEVLILDDSMSALDYATDAKLRKGLQTLSYRPTIFMVSQRTTSIRHADKILVLEDGKVLDIGRHEELLERCNTYLEIHESQFKDIGKAGA